MELELYTAQPVCDVGIVEALNKNLPGMRVIIGDTSWSWIRVGERLCCASYDKRPADLREFHALAELVLRRHLVIKRSLVNLTR